MPFTICLPDGINPKAKCWDIPVIIVKYPGPDPDPFFTRVSKAIRLVLSPSPEPWVTGSLAASGLAEQTVRDARILATMDDLAAKLSPSLRAGVAQSVETAARNVALPQGAGLTIAAR